MGLFLVWCHRPICIILSLCKHTRKEVFEVKQGMDPHPLLVRSCDRRWPDFVTFTACKRSIFRLKRGTKTQCVSNKCKDLYKRKKDFGVMGSLRYMYMYGVCCCNVQFTCIPSSSLLIHQKLSASIVSKVSCDSWETSWFSKSPSRMH